MRRRVFVATLIVSLVVAVTMCVAVLATQGLVLFSWHPVFAALGGVWLFVWGTLRFYSEAANTPDSPGREQARESHRAWILAGVGSLVIAVACIVLNKLRFGKSVVPHSVHAWVGAAVLAVMAMQTMVGLLKLAAWRATGTKQFRWHGAIGPFVLLSLLFTVLLGVWKWKGDLVVKALLSAGVVVVGGLFMWTVALGRDARTATQRSTEWGWESVALA